MRYSGVGPILGETSGVRTRQAVCQVVGSVREGVESDSTAGDALPRISIL